MDPFSLIVGGGASIIGGLLGRDAAKDAARAQQRGIKQGLSEFDSMTAGAEGTVNAGADKATGYIQPYAEGGNNALKLYLDAVGANGTGAQTSYYQTFQDDPGFKAALDQGGKQVEHASIFKGRSQSGATMKELMSYGENARLGAYKDRLSQLQSLSQIGLQASTTGANIETNRGTTLADIALKKGDAHLRARTGMGQVEAGGIAQQGNIMRNTLADITSLALRNPTGIGGGTPTGSTGLGGGKSAGLYVN